MGDIHEYRFENTETLFEFITYFESNGKEYDVSREFSLDPYSYHDQASHFITMLYENNIIVQFNWTNWIEEANAYFKSPSLIVNADLIMIRQLFTTIIRSERFNAGKYASMIDNRVILALLKRLKVLVDNHEKGEHRMNLLNKAIIIATKMHDGQTDQTTLRANRIMFLS
ncbi:hypothetical protein SAMN03159341_1314 [Paenibacillus sp. 1_12]|uniref:DUF6508 domain-containing protein n=1 Tax=Paenibacillus sp. 1_12 TaxID=1566278 RepID=UPI0008E90532|nr:DUF6508 domain-containing protein [Paenibacillus sp. 1_12]SFM39936.1 hypothetical protein SAMN03159341_1314 [Paenibacillus sp. 1_12]